MKKTHRKTCITGRPEGTVEEVTDSNYGPVKSSCDRKGSKGVVLDACILICQQHSVILIEEGELWANEFTT